VFSNIRQNNNRQNNNLASRQRQIKPPFRAVFYGFLKIRQNKTKQYELSNVLLDCSFKNYLVLKQF